MDTCVVQQETNSPVENLIREWFDLSDTQRQVLQLIRHIQSVSKSGHVQPRRQYLADKIGVGVQAVTRAISRLRSLGVIRTTFRGRKGNRSSIPDEVMALDLKNPKSWVVHSAKNPVETPVDLTEEMIKSLLDDALNDQVNDQVNDSISPMYSSHLPSSNSKDKTGIVRGCGDVHNSSSCATSPTPSLRPSHGLFNEKTVQEVEDTWRGYILETGEQISQEQLTRWRMFGPDAVHGALLAYRHELRRRADVEKRVQRGYRSKRTETRPLSVRWIQASLSQRTWIRMLEAAQNRATALGYVAGSSRIFKQVTYGSVHLPNGSAVGLEVFRPDRFIEYVYQKTGTLMKCNETYLASLCPVRLANG